MLLPQAIENVESHNDEAKRIIFFDWWWVIFNLL